MDTVLRQPVAHFAEAVTPALLVLAYQVDGIKRERVATDVMLEAADLVAAFIDVDGRHSDVELWPYITTFGPHFDTQLLRATPNDLRIAGLIAGKRSWLERPSLLFDILVAADQRDGTQYARAYYDHALALAHVVVSLDELTSAAELQALDRFRSLLLGAMGNPRPAAAGQIAAQPVAVAAQTKDAPPPRPLEELLAELDALIGLAPVKAEVRLVADLLQVYKLRRERDLATPDRTHHLVFTGNPGTGKTTVARLLAQIYRTLEVVGKGHLVETDRAGLVAGFVGQTASKVVAVFDAANEGVLLIDEAYALARGSGEDFGREAIDTIVKLVEDRRDDIVVIVAGYPDEMTMLFDTNPGLRSRFPTTIHFPDYTTADLVAIFGLIAQKGHYELEDAAKDAVKAFFDAAPRGRGFGNGRLARTLFEQAVANQASRIVGAGGSVSDATLITLTAEDIPSPE